MFLAIKVLIQTSIPHLEHVRASLSQLAPVARARSTPFLVYVLNFAIRRARRATTGEEEEVRKVRTFQFHEIMPPRAGV